MSTDEKLKLLGEPVSDEDIEWMPRHVFQTDKSATGYVALAVPYVTNRFIQTLLDQVMGPANWRNEFRPAVNAPGDAVECGLSLRIDGEWITKFDAAENSDIEGVKGGYSNAMKRAGVQWGIGRSLYDLPPHYFACEVKGNPTNGEKPKFRKWAEALRTKK